MSFISTKSRALRLALVLIAAVTSTSATFSGTVAVLAFQQAQAAPALAVA